MILSFSFSKQTVPAARQALLLLKILAAVLFFCFALLFGRTKDSAMLLKAVQCAAVFALCFLPRALHLGQSASALLFAIFLFIAAILGSVFAFFERFLYYDVAVHLLSGVLCVCALRDFAAVKNTALSGRGFVLAALLVTAALAGLWEMYEFVAFHMLRNTAFSLRAMLGELGFFSAKQAATGAIKENLALSFGTVEGLLQNAYDTFCDMLCALVAGGSCAVLLCTRKSRNTAAGRQ
ncbi:MAG: hypothetical protein IJJ41_04460 [Clostridia bacterium]|nr:hypothetical protein [Clostridia bacterium]